MDSIISGENFYDADGVRQGYSVDSVFGGQNYYDERGRFSGYSLPGLFGGESIRIEDAADSEDSSWDDFDSSPWDE